MPFVRTSLTAAAVAASGLLLAGLVFLSAGGYGVRLNRRLWSGKLSVLEELVFAPTLGYGIISLLMFAAGGVNAWTRWGAWFLLAAGLGLSQPYLKVLRGSGPTGTHTAKPSVLLVLISAFWCFILALAPITYYDSLVYHYALPAAYIQAHHWLSLKELIYSAFPQNLEMLWTFGMLLAHDTVSNLTSLALAGLVAGATFAFANRFMDRPAGRIAVVLLVTMPAYLLLSSGGYVDIGVTLYSFASLYALCVWKETGERRTLLLSGLLAGLALGVKYTAGIPFAAGGLLLLWQSRANLTAAAQNALIYGGSALLPLGPWLIKNLIYVGNPVFPFFYSWGNPRLSPWVQGAAAGYFRGIAEYEPRSLGELLRLPWDLAVHSVRFGRGMDILGDYGWAPLMLLLPFLFWCRKRPRIIPWLLAYSALYVIPWAFSRPVLRFLLPLAPVLALLASIAWTEGIQHCSTYLRRLAQGGGRGLVTDGFCVLLFCHRHH